MNILRLLIFVLPLAIACSDSTEPEIVPDYVHGADEYNVLSALIDTEYAWASFQDYYDLIVISHFADQLQSVSDDSIFVLNMITQGLPSVSKDAAEDLWKKTRIACLWQDSFKTRVPYAWPEDSIFFHSLRVHGSLTLSRVGFNADHTQAVLHASFYCGMLCAEWYFACLEKNDGRWILVKKYIYMMS